MPESSPKQVLRTPADVDDALAAGFWSARCLVVSLPGLTDNRRASIQRDLDRFADACGCEMGSLVLLITGALFVVLRVFPAGRPAGGALLLEALLVLLPAALAGKLIGLVMARTRRRQTLLRLRKNRHHGEE